MACCISFGTVNVKIFIPLFGGLLGIISQLVRSFSKLIDHPIMLAINSSFGMTLSLIPYLIMIKIAKTKNTEILLSSQQKSGRSKSLKINYRYHDIYQEITKGKFKYILLAAFLDFFQTILALFSDLQQKKINSWIIEFIFICILSYYIFGTKLYNHQKLSLIIIIILVLFLDLYYNDFFREGDLNFLTLFIRVIQELIISFLMVLYKYLIEKKFLSAYEICFFIGVITLIFYSICIIISSRISSESQINLYNVAFNGKYYFDHFFSYFEIIDIKEIMLFIVIMLIEFFVNISIILTIRYFSPTHSLIILVIGNTASIILEIKRFKEKIKNIIYLLILLVILFFLLIFNEVIELNCFKLERNTAENIKRRATNESQQDINDENRDESSYLSESNSEPNSFVYASSN